LKLGELELKIFIHIGHGKTGTSAIQSFLATNREKLLDYGVDYPEHSSFSLAKEGKITSGNGELLLSPFQFNSNNHSYLFSNEGLYFKLSDKEKLSRLVHSLPVKPTIICYTRDLVDYYISSWGQYIKRGRGVRDIDNRVQSIEGFYGILANYISWADELGYSIVVNNYSRHSENLVEHFVSLILGHNIDVDKDFEFENKVVNRSLTRSEYKVQQLFNKYSTERTNRFVSDKLVNSLPGLEVDKPFIRNQTYQNLIDRSLKDIDFINRHIDPLEKIDTSESEYVQESIGGKNKQQYFFSEDQLDVLIKSIMEKINE